MSKPQRRKALTLLALLGYMCAGFIFTVHAWMDATHSLPGVKGDSYKFADFLAWIPHALSNAHNPFNMNVIDYPRGVNLAWDTPVPFAGILTWPVSATLGPAVAYNTWVVVALATNGWCTFLWLGRHVKRFSAAFLGGLFCALGPYAAAHALGHLNLIAFAPIPLLAIVFEKLLEAKATRWKLALAAGVLAAAQLYISEELLVVAAIAGVVACAVAGVTNWQGVRARLSYFITVLALAGVVFSALAAPMLLYQFFGPYKIHGNIQPFNVYVTDVANLVIPTGVTWVPLVDATAPISAKWTGNTAEQTGYLGLPLIAICLYATVRWWRSPDVRVIALSTAILEILSFGPHLHLHGTDTGLPLPGAVFSYIPLLSDLLPGRLSVVVEVGAAGLLAVTIDRSLVYLSRANTVVLALAVLSLIIALPHPIEASSSPIPRYFTSMTGAKHLPEGTIALVGPYIIDDRSSAVPMLWQAEADFHFSLIDGLAINPDDNGHAVGWLTNPFSDVFQRIQVGALCRLRVKSCGGRCGPC